MFALDHVPPRLRTALADTATAQSGVVSRRQLHRLGVTRWMIVANLRAQRWRLHGRQSICLHTGTLAASASRWYAVIESGPRAALDGISALEAAGLKGFEGPDSIRVSVPRGAPAVRRPGLMVRQTRRLQRSDVVGAGVPRVRVPVAAVRAALWAVSDRQAATILAMVVQQRLCRAADIGEALLAVRRHRRKTMLEAVVLDLIDGAQAMGELDFARLCRAHGLPSPDRQVVRRTSRGAVYLDAYWSAFRLVVEVDGIHHLKVSAVVSDALRQNDLALASDTVLRLPLLGLRVAPDDLMRQVRAGLVAGGWTPPTVTS
jgi:very-short-patch-repair endonuclease